MSKQENKLEYTRKVVYTEVEQTGKFYSGSFYDFDGNLILKIKDDEEYIDALCFVQSLGIPIDYQIIPIDVS